MTVKYLLDKEITNDLFDISQKILKDFFFYGDEEIDHFCSITASKINSEHLNLKFFSSAHFRESILTDKYQRSRFTVYFVGFHICRILVEHFHFGESELEQFENIILKLTEGK